jgi:hypothetical protein
VGIGAGVSPHFANADAQQHNDNAATKNIIRNDVLIEVMAGMISRNRLFVTKN